MLALDRFCFLQHSCHAVLCCAAPQASLALLDAAVAAASGAAGGSSSNWLAAGIDPQAASSHFGSFPADRMPPNTTTGALAAAAGSPGNGVSAAAAAAAAAAQVGAAGGGLPFPSSAHAAAAQRVKASVGRPIGGGSNNTSGMVCQVGVWGEVITRHALLPHVSLPLAACMHLGPGSSLQFGPCDQNQQLLRFQTNLQAVWQPGQQPVCSHQPTSTPSFDTLKEPGSSVPLSLSLPHSHTHRLGQFTPHTVTLSLCHSLTLTQVPGCLAPLTGTHISPYFRRHRVCVAHAKADTVAINGKTCRYMQEARMLPRGDPLCP